MDKRFRAQLATLGLGLAVIMAVAGCDLGNPTATPVVNPTSTAQVSSTAVANPTDNVVQATPTTVETVVPVDTATSVAVPPTDVPQAGVTPSTRQVAIFADYKL